MKSIVFLGSVLLSILLTACAPVVNPPPAPEQTVTPVEVTVSRLRIQNVGEQDLVDLVVIFPESRVEFGDVPAGSTSEYMDVPLGVYNYAAYEYRYQGEALMQPVLDWVGETPRPGRSYTYVLDFDPERENMLAIELVKVVADPN